MHGWISWMSFCVEERDSQNCCPLVLMPPQSHQQPARFQLTAQTGADADGN